MSKTLVLQNITMEDRGVYLCKAATDATIYYNASAKVTVYGKHDVTGVLL